MDGRRREREGGEEWGQEKLSHQKNLISHSDTHESGGREAGAAGNGCERVCVCACVCAKGIHFQLSYHTPLSTDMLACFFCLSRDPRSTNICAYYRTHTQLKDLTELVSLSVMRGHDVKRPWYRACFRLVYW